MLTRDEIEMQRELEVDLARSLLLSVQIDSEEFAARQARIEDTYRRMIARGEARPRRRLMQGATALLVVLGLAFAATVDPDERSAAIAGVFALCGIGAVMKGLFDWDRTALRLLDGGRLADLVLDEPEFSWAPGERENALVCLRLKNYSTLLEISGGVLFSRTMGELLDLIEAHASAHDGILQIGFAGQIRVVFGSPASEARRLERAVRFALDLRHTLATREYKPTDGLRRLRLGMGIHQGRVTSGLIGGRRRRTFHLCGKTLELADELADAAAGGEIFLSDPASRELEIPRSLGTREPMFSTSQNQVVRIHSLEDEGRTS